MRLYGLLGGGNEIVWIIGGGGQMRLYGLLGGQVCICVQSMGQTRGGPGACSPTENLVFDHLLDAIWWNLGLFCTSIIHLVHLLCH